MKLFRELTKTEKAKYIQWARDNYKPNDPIETIWHPVIRAECKKINHEYKLKKRAI